MSRHLTASATGRQVSLKKFLAAILAIALAVIVLQAINPPPAGAAEQAHAKIVGPTPVNFTPNVLDGEVLSIAEVGDMIVLGGTFTQVRAASGGEVLTRNRIVAFNKFNGTISATFAPSFNSTVRSVVAAPDGQSVYVGGQFGTMNGTVVPKAIRLKLSDGLRVSAFNPPSINALVHDMKLSGNRLFIAGEFTRVGNQDRGGLAELDPTTGAVRASTHVTFAGTHRGGNTFVRKFDVSPDGKRLVATGNFATIDGLDRVQVGVIDVSGTAATVATWQTDRWKPMCYASFASYLTDLDYAPDGSYFVLGSTGGYGSGPPTLCDSISRWDAAANSAGTNPVWINYTGGDSVYALEATGDTIYFGGHMRWVNNPFRADAAGQGAVGREGIGALNSSSGMPNAWNPGRDRGRAVFDMLATEQGLWVGSDTDRIARYLYRARIAMFPLSSGTDVVKSTPAALPVDVMQVGAAATSTDSRYLHRINAGGSTIPAADGGIDWLGDGLPPASTYRTQDNNTASYESVGSLHQSVPASTPRDVFSTERWDPAGGNEMGWDLPVSAGKNVQLRIYLANRYSGTASAGTRVFSIEVEGASAFPSVDLSATPGHDTGYMVSKNLVSDGTVNIRFLHQVENPLVNAIEVVDLDAPAPNPGVAGVPNELYFDGSVAADKGETTVTGDVGWSDVRGGFATNSAMYLAMSDGTFQRRSFNGTGVGAADTLDLYGLSNFSTEIQSMTGMFLWNNRLYFTLSGQNSLFMRYFDLNSSIVGAQRFTVAAQPPGFSWADVRGMFLSGNGLYVAKPDGTLSKIDWNTQVMDGGTVGAPTALSGPAIDGLNWTSRSLIALPSDGPPALPNESPTAVIGADCSGLQCTFSSTDSSDPDGEIAEVAWLIGGEQASTEPTFTHTFGAAGSYEVSLTVTDDAGAQHTALQTVTVEALPVENQPPVVAFAEDCAFLVCTFDGAGTTDADGTVDTYTWTIGGDVVGSGEVLTYEFPQAGSHEVTLEATDNEGASASLTRTVVVSQDPGPEPSEPVAYVAAAANPGTATARVHSLTIPSDVQVGDLMIAVLSTNAGAVDITVPAGWDARAESATAGMRAVMISRYAEQGDAGSQLALGTSILARGSLTLAAYRNAGVDAAAFEMQSETVNTATHVTPVLVADSGDWVLSYWGDKTAATSSWTLPAGLERRLHGAGTGAGHLSWHLADSNGPVSGGNVGGNASTANAATANAVTATVVIGAIE